MFNAAKEEFLDWFELKSTQKIVAHYADQIADREIARLQSSLGGTIKEVEGIPDFDQIKGLSPQQNLLGFFLKKILYDFQNKSFKPSDSRSTENPYAK
jgi:hypothetical protein